MSYCIYISDFKVDLLLLLVYIRPVYEGGAGGHAPLEIGLSKKHIKGNPYDFRKILKIGLLS